MQRDSSQQRSGDEEQAEQKASLKQDYQLTQAGIL